MLVKEILHLFLWGTTVRLVMETSRQINWTVLTDGSLLNQKLLGRKEISFKCVFVNLFRV